MGFKIKNEDVYISCFVFVSAIFCLSFLVDIGFTTNDDSWNYLRYTQNPISLEEIKQGIKLYGFRLLHFVFISVPYLLDSFLWFKVTQISALLFSILSLSFLIYKISANKYMGYFVCILCFGFLQNYWGHNILTSYPFIFHACLGLIFSSLILFYYFLNTEKLLFFLLSILFFLIPLLVTEVHVFYSVLFLFLVVLHQKRHNLSLQEYKKRYIFSGSYIGLSLLFIVVYFYLKSMYGQNYSGSLIDISNISNVFAVLWQYTVSSIPSYIYFNMDLSALTFDRDFFYSSERNFFNILFLLDLRWHIISIITSVLSFYCFLRYQKVRIIYIAFIVVSLVFMFIVNLPLALTPKYQEWVLNKDLSYIYTFYSYLAFVVLFVSILGVVSTFISSKYKKVMATLVALMVFVLSIFNSYGNQIIYHTQTLSTQKWKQIDKYLQSELFGVVPNNSTILALSINNRYSIMGTNADYWSQYIKHKTGKQVRIVDNVKDIQKLSQKDLFYLKFNQSYNSSSGYVVQGKINNIKINQHNQPQYLGSYAIISTINDLPKINLIGQTFKDNAIISVNNIVYHKQPKSFSIPTFFLENKKNKIRFLTIKSEELVLNTINIDFFTLAQEWQ